MKSFLIFWIKKIISFLISAGIIWWVISVIFVRLDQKLPWFIALLLTYIISAYIILPRLIRLILLITRKGRIPRFTRASDGLHVDPINLILIGTKENLEKAFEKIEWQKADKLNPKSVTKMIRTFLANKPYPKAPFSSLYLFGRRQDIGFQQSINNSPRKRHHIRFWAINTDKIIDPFDIKFWTKKQKIQSDKIFMWVGAGSQDIGFGIKKLTYQITHRVDPDVDRERKYILDLLKKSKSIGKTHYYKSGNFKIGKYISDGKIAVAKLV